MKKKKYIIAISLCMATLVGILVFPFGASAQPAGNAYAVLDDSGELTLFRSTETYTNKSTGTFTDIGGESYTGTVFAGFENSSKVGESNIPWKAYRDNITKVSMAQEIEPIDISWWFYSCGNLVEVDLSKIAPGSLTGMDGVFENCPNLKVLDIHTLDTTNITSMDGIIHGLKSLVKIKLGNNFRFTEKASVETTPPIDPFPGEAYAVFDSTDGSLTFFRDEEGKYTNEQTDGTKTYYAGVESTGTTTDTIPWYSQRSNVTSVTFEDAIRPAQTYSWFNMVNLTSITGLEKLDTSNVTSMYGMLAYCQSLTSLDVSHFDTSNVTDMYAMFYDCENLTSLDVSHFDTSKVTSMYAMFYDCENLTSLDVSHFDTLNVTNMEYMFSSCHSLTSLDVSHFDTSNVTNMEYMFSSCHSLTSLDVSHFDTSKVTNMYAMFGNCQSLTSLDVSHFDTLNVTNMEYMFSSCQNLTSLDVSHFDTSKVTSMYSMFGNCQSLTSLDVSHFDTSNVTNMEYMFSSCQNLTSLDVSHFDTSKVTSMYSMFGNCEKLTTTLNIMNMPSSYNLMCANAATQSGTKITLKYISPVTSANVNTLVATKSSGGNVVNGGQGTFVPPTPPVPLN